MITEKPRRVLEHPRGVDDCEGVDVNENTCAVEGCGIPRVYRLYCNGHYRRWKRSGTPGPADLRMTLREPVGCSFDGCGNRARTQGLCAGHYGQKWKGVPLAALKPAVDTTARDSEGRKLCNKCNEWKPVDGFYANSGTKDKLATHCKACHKESSLSRTYGLNSGEYEAMEAQQGGVCKICGGVNDDGRRLFVDHDHSTGDVRGLLCNPCNRAVGLMQDNPERLRKAAAYLEAYRT